MGLLVEGDHDPSLGEFPCARACVAAGDALGRAEEEEPLLEDIPQSKVGVGSEAVWKGHLELLKERLDKKFLFSCSVLFSSHFKTTFHTASELDFVHFWGKGYQETTVVR